MRAIELNVPIQETIALKVLQLRYRVQRDRFVQIHPSALYATWAHTVLSDRPWRRTALQGPFVELQLICHPVQRVATARLHRQRQSRVVCVPWARDLWLLATPMEPTPYVYHVPMVNSALEE